MIQAHKKHVGIGPPFKWISYFERLLSFIWVLFFCL